MKKSLIVQTIITSVAMLLIVVFAVYALLIANQSRTSININVADENLDFSLEGSAGWSGDSFNTHVGPNGLVNKVWNLPDLKLKTKNLSTPEELSIKISNKNQHPEYNLKLTISGLAYDDFGFEERYTTFVTCLCNDVELEDAKNHQITKDSPTFEITVAGDTKKIEFVVTYFLKQSSSSFDVSQDIIVTIDSEDKSHD